MKIILANRFFYPDESATAQLLSDLAFDLAASGQTVHVVTGRRGYDDPTVRLPKSEIIHGVRVHRAWSPGYGRHRIVGRLLDYLSFYVISSVLIWRMVRAGDIVVVKTDPPLLSILGRPICRSKGAHLVCWLQDVFPEVAVRHGVLGSGSILTRVLIRLRDASLKRARCCVVVSEKMADFVAARGVSKDRIATIPNWADGESIRPVPEETNELRDAWGLRDCFVVGYSGNFGKVHDYQTIRDAIWGLRQRPDIRFVFVGGGAYMETLKTWAAAHAPGNVSFQPYHPRKDLARSLSVPDVHLVSLDPQMEGLVYPSKLYGILAAGRPTLFVGNSAGEISQLLHDNDCGISVQTGHTEDLTAAIEDLAADPTRRMEMGANARRLFERHYDRRVTLAAWRGVLTRAE